MPWKKCKCVDCGKLFRSRRAAYKHEVWTGHKTEEIKKEKPKQLAIKTFNIEKFFNDKYFEGEGK